MAQIKIVVTQERFDEIVSLDDWINFDQLTNDKVYGYMLQFVVDEEGKPLTVEAARTLFKGIPKKEWQPILLQFVTAIRDAFVNPTSGSSSDAPPPAEPISLPIGPMS